MNVQNGVNACDPLALIEILRHGSKSTEAQLDSALAPIGLSVAKWGLLKQLASGGGRLSLGDLAERLACVKSNVTQLVDRLEADHLVRRVPDAADRRSIHAELTEQGNAVFTEGVVIVKAFEKALLNEFTEEERMILHRLLVRFAAGVVPEPV
jgi:DNA-binding MarR family transcriptional regulator